MDNPEFQALTRTVKKLRDPQNGCPWDLKQTHLSLLKFLIEESYEFVHATEKQNYQEMEEELGDVLFQVLLHSSMAEEKKAFSLESVSRVLNEKLIRRHPHVFGDEAGQEISTEQIKKNWEKIKKEEKKDKEESTYSLDQEMMAFPSLTSAYKIGKKTEGLHFDWESAHQVSYKVEEEWQELKEELMPEKKNLERIEEELGDFLFSTAQLARHLGLDPEQTLRKANQKFIKRFQKVEDLIAESKANISELDQDKMDSYWAQVKSME